ncbi:NUDIX domain-containing protein [Salinibacterium sp. SWN248]|uniref:NUDIX domain-containing protein n=1 Tax=Salinibacterium sp. SWN248 TaxID=2792056 RepID=UPI0027D9E08E|nr:NUDIX domain-containing protein [Salinibacterium sp. SWN248]
MHRPACGSSLGGKIEADQILRDALAREISEELEFEVSVGELLSKTPVLTEHAEVRWLAPAELSDLEWAPTDIPVVELIEKTGSAP